MAVPDDAERREWLRLLACGLDRHSLSALAAAFRSPRGIFESSDGELAQRFGLGDQPLRKLRSALPAKLLDKQCSLLEAHSIDVLPLSDPDYPRNLFELRVPPAAIFVKGRLEAEDRLAVTIVGPRMPTPYGMDVTRRLARQFASTMTVLSGAALGVDSAAHQATLESGGRTAAVLGCGIDQDYPVANGKLRARIVEDGGALISQFPPGTPPMRGNFPMRNYVLAGLSLAVIVVEASEKSGALVTARAAAEEGRPVYAVPGDITRPNSAGSNQLLKEGAGVCTGADDVLADLQGLLEGELESLRMRRLEQVGRLAALPSPDGVPLPDVGSATPESSLLAAIRHSPLNHDELVERFVPESFTLGDLSTALLMLELRGQIRQLPGRVYAVRA